MYYPVEIGKNIVALRRARGFSQETLAEQANICVGWMREVEHDCANATRDILEGIAKALDVPVWVIYGLQLEPDAVWTELSEIQTLPGLEERLVLARHE